MTPAVIGALLAGALLGHAARRALPALLGLKDRSLPFGGPWLEIATAALFAASAWRLGGLGPWPVFCLVLGLTAISACDYLVKLIPDRLTYSLIAVGLLAAAVEPRLLFALPIQRWMLLSAAPALQGQVLEGVLLAAAGALLGFFALEAIRRFFGLLAGLEVMGLGDSKLAAAIGAFLGPVGVLIALPLSFFLGVLHGLLYLRLSGQPHSPFGPPLALAGWLALLFHRDLGAAIGAFQNLILGLPLPQLAGLYTLLIAIAVLLIWRMRQKASEYEALIEEDYRQVEDRLEE